MEKLLEIIRTTKDKLHIGDVKDKTQFYNLLKDCDYLITGATMIGGISYFHDFAYDRYQKMKKLYQLQLTQQ